MKELSNRTATFTDSVIRRMTRISNKYGAVNLSQGFPDFDPPAQLLNSLSAIASDPKPLYHQYSITWGSQAMREALAAKQEHFMGMPINPNENIVVTCGSTEAMMAAMMTVTNPGDKVVIFSPFYENYGADTILSGAEPIYVPLNPPAFDFDRETLEAAFRDNDPKAIVLCNPSNPCGKVFTREELTLIADLCKKYDAYCITDEVYEHIVYAPHEHVYMATLPGMFDRTIAAVRCLRRTPSPAGVWATPSPRPRSPSALKRSTTSSPWVLPLPCRKLSSPPSNSTTAITRRSSTSTPPSATYSVRGSIASVLSTTCRRAPTM